MSASSLRQMRHLLHSICTFTTSVRIRIVKWGSRGEGFLLPNWSARFCIICRLLGVDVYILSVGSVGGSCLFLLVVGCRLSVECGL